MPLIFKGSRISWSNFTLKGFVIQMCFNSLQITSQFTSNVLSICMALHFCSFKLFLRFEKVSRAVICISVSGDSSVLNTDNPTSLVRA